MLKVSVLVHYWTHWITGLRSEPSAVSATPWSASGPEEAALTHLGFMGFLGEEPGGG